MEEVDLLERRFNGHPAVQLELLPGRTRMRLTLTEAAPKGPKRS